MLEQTDAVKDFVRLNLKFGRIPMLEVYRALEALLEYAEAEQDAWLARDERFDDLQELRERALAQIKVEK